MSIQARSCREGGARWQCSGGRARGVFNPRLLAATCQPRLPRVILITVLVTGDDYDLFHTGGTMSTACTDLKVWHKAMDLAVEIYQSTKAFPRDEIYGLTSQMRRAAVSVPSNIAEGRGRFSHRELSQFLLHSRGSLLELETQLLLAARIGYLKPAETERLLSMTSELGRMLNGFLKTLQTHSAA